MYCALLNVQQIGIHEKNCTLTLNRTHIHGVTKQDVHRLICSPSSLRQNKRPRKFLDPWIVIYVQQFSVHDAGFAFRNGSFHSNLSQNETIASLCILTEIKMFYYFK